MWKLEAVDDECPATVCGVYVEQDGRFISSVSLLSCHSSSVWEGLCFSGVSPDELTAKKTELVQKSFLFTGHYIRFSLQIYRLTSFKEHASCMCCEQKIVENIEIRRNGVI